MQIFNLYISAVNNHRINGKAFGLIQLLELASGAPRYTEQCPYNLLTCLTLIVVTTVCLTDA